jgi:flagellar FliJ protein
MKKFKFRLQKLLDIREARETEIKHELMKVLNVQNQERIFQEELKQKINLYETRYGQKIKKGTLSVEEMISLMRYADVSRKAIIESQKRVENLEPEVRRIREKLVIASREKKVVEKLKERKLQEFNYEFNREQFKENDDMNQKIYQRKLV